MKKEAYKWVKDALDLCDELDSDMRLLEHADDGIDTVGITIAIQEVRNKLEHIKNTRS